MDDSARARFAVAVDRAGHGVKGRFAAAAGVNASSVRNWLAGETDPAFSAMAAGCVLLGVSLDWIAYGTPPEGIDRQLLADVITAVEDVLAESALVLATDRRARVVAHYYADCLSRMQTVDRGELLRLIELAA